MSNTQNLITETFCKEANWTEATFNLVHWEAPNASSATESYCQQVSLCKVVWIIE